LAPGRRPAPPLALEQRVPRVELPRGWEGHPDSSSFRGGMIVQTDPRILAYSLDCLVRGFCPIVVRRQSEVCRSLYGRFEKAGKKAAVRCRKCRRSSCNVSQWNPCAVRKADRKLLLRGRRHPPHRTTRGSLEPGRGRQRRSTPPEPLGRGASAIRRIPACPIPRGLRGRS
jgi:hypothetical protein